MPASEAALQHEAAFRQEAVLAVIMIIAAFLTPVTTTERVLLIASVVLVMIVELLNSAIEAVVDRVGSEHHELSGRAKDHGFGGRTGRLVADAICLG